MKVTWGLVSGTGGTGRAGAGFFRFWEGRLLHFPLLVGRGYSEKGLGIVKTKLPLAVSGFATFHRVLLSLCKRGASMGNPW